MTVAEMLDRMDDTEILHWGAYFKMEAEEMRDRMSEQRAVSLANRNFRR